VNSGGERLGVDVVGVLEVPGGSGGMDEVQMVTLESGAWSLWPIASSSGRRMRTEWFLATVASVVDGLIETLGVRRNGRHQHVHQGKRRRKEL
jgi:hypothetical protein